MSATPLIIRNDLQPINIAELIGMIPSLNVYDVISWPFFVREGEGLVLLECQGTMRARKMTYSSSKNGAGWTYLCTSPPNSRCIVISGRINVSFLSEMSVEIEQKN